VQFIRSIKRLHILTPGCDLREFYNKEYIYSNFMWPGIFVRERKNQLDAVNLKFIDVSHSTCFRHHYAHDQEYSKGRKTAYGVLHWSCRADLKQSEWLTSINFKLTASLWFFLLLTIYLFLCSKTPRGWNSSAKTCRFLILIMIWMLLSASFGRYIDCNNIHGMNNMKTIVFKHPVTQDVLRICFPRVPLQFASGNEIIATCFWKLATFIFVHSKNRWVKTWLLLNLAILGFLNNSYARSNMAHALCLRVRLLNYLDFVSRQGISIIKYSRREISEDWTCLCFASKENYWMALNSHKQQIDFFQQFSSV
jgi:hypothetical protein